MKKLLCLILVAAATCDASAGGAVTGKVLSVRTDQDGKGMIIFDKAVTGPFAACRSADYPNALAFNANTPGGRLIASMALTAKASGGEVTAYGTGACGIYSVVEDMDYGAVR